MDVNPILNAALDIVLLVSAPVAVMLARAGIRVLRDKLHLDISAADEAALETAVQTGAGVLRADLATGKITLPDIQLGGPHVERAAQIAMNIAGQVAASSNLTKNDIAARIVASLGHALGDDPQVPSVAPPDPPSPVAVALAKAAQASVVALALLGVGGTLAACTPEQAAQAQKAIQDGCAADQALVPQADTVLQPVPGTVGAAAALDASVVHPMVSAGCAQATKPSQP